MKIQFPAGGAKPGPALAGAGIQMPKFCTAFNDQTKDRMGETVPVVLTIYEDKRFDFVLKTAPTAEMIKKACGIKKAASDSKQTVATLSADKLKEIAEYKMPDLNANDLEGAMRIVAGTARNMGVKVEGLDAQFNEEEKKTWLKKVKDIKKPLLLLKKVKLTQLKKQLL